MVLDAVKKRDVSVDILKFFAVILITNSHMHTYMLSLVLWLQVEQ